MLVEVRTVCSFH